MGRLVDGVWESVWYDTKKTQGAFVRKPTHFHSRIKSDHSTEFSPEAGRYHLYVSLACPWAHRTLIMRKLKELEEAISLSVVNPLMGERGWSFAKGEGVLPDTCNKSEHLYEVYLKADSRYSGRVTVPILWDKKNKTIVNNESAEIIRMFNSEFGAVGAAEHDYYPEALRGDIDAVNVYVYNNINNGVYRCGFATTQKAYEKAFKSLFEALDTIEDRLGRNRYLVNGELTEADIRLFTTLIRFDSVYVGHFKCNKHRIVDYPNLSNYLKELYQIPGFGQTVNMSHIKDHYYQSHETINPTRIVPLGPELDLKSPHDRDRFRK